MPEGALSEIYRNYIHCLNTQDWAHLGDYVSEDVSYNGEPVGLAGYRRARQDEFRDIPDLHFDVRMCMTSADTVASRLVFRIRPRGDFLGLPVNGRRICFSEHVFYEFENGRIARVWSVLDKTAIRMQLQAQSQTPPP